MPPGANVFKAIIRPRRSRPDAVQDVRLELFNWDGSPFESGGGSSEHSAWLPVANADMQNGWTNHLSHAVRYRVRANGLVEWQGHLDPGSPGTIFVLPPEARPLDLEDGFSSWKCHANGDAPNDATISVTEDSMICNILPNGVNYINIGCIMYAID